MGKKSILFKAVKSIAASRGDNQGDLSKAIKVHNAYFWKTLNDEWIRFDHLKKACEEYGALIIIRSRKPQKLEYILHSNMKQLFTAIQHMTFDCDMDQRDLADKINRDNAWFWERLGTEKVRYQYLKDACDVLEADIILQVMENRQRKEYILNPAA